MSIVLLIIYILVFIFLIITLLKCLKNKVLWWKIFVFEIVSIIFSVILMRFFDSLPGYGLMPGLSYVEEFFVSFFATFIYIGILVVTIVLRLIMFFKKK